MAHLDNSRGVLVALVYSIITYFFTPYILSKVFKIKTKNACTLGFVIGSIVSIILWVGFGQKFTMKPNISNKMKPEFFTSIIIVVSLLTIVFVAYTKNFCPKNVQFV